MSQPGAPSIAAAEQKEGFMDRFTGWLALTSTNPLGND